jgi:hypothetical protein
MGAFRWWEQPGGTVRLGTEVSRDAFDWFPLGGCLSQEVGWL